MRGSGVSGRPCAALYSGREFGCIVSAGVVGTVYQRRGSGVSGRPCAALYSGREFGCILFATIVGAKASESPSVPLCLPVSLGLPDCFSAETVYTLWFIQLQPTVTVPELCWYGFRVCERQGISQH